MLSGSKRTADLCLRYVALLGAAVAWDSLQPGQEFDRQKHLECSLDSQRRENWHWLPLQ